MIDWVTCVLPCTHNSETLSSGRVFSMSPSGEIEWQVDKPLKVKGSHSSNIIIRSNTERSIWISGNPVKFLQGHNIFGTNDLVYLVSKFFYELLKIKELQLCPTINEKELIEKGEYFLSHVDVNESWHLKDRATVLAWIRSAGNSAVLKRRGAGQFTADTLYFAKKSRRWGVKCYSKGQEISAKNHKLPKELCYPELIDWANKSLRIELVIRSMGLKSMHLDYAKNWNVSTPKMLLCSLVLDDLQLSDNMAIPDDLLLTLPLRLKGVYSLWLSGQDLRAQMPKPTFYRWRKALLPYGIDISLVQEKNASNVVPLIRYLEALPAEIPSWAYDYRLVA